MLMVAPSGRTVEATTGRTPSCVSATAMLTGRVAELDEVEKATSIASSILRKKRSGESFSTNFISPP